MKRKYSNYFQWGLTVVCTVTVCMLIFFVLFRYEGFLGFFRKLNNVLLPVFIGAVIAYLLNPIVNFLTEKLTRFFLKLHMTHRRAGNLSLAISIVLSLSAFLLAIYFLLSLILPELYQNIRNFASHFQDYVTTVQNWFSELHIFEEQPELYNSFQTLFDKVTGAFEEWISTALLGKLSNILSNVTVGIIGFFNTLLDIVVGLIASVYIMYSKRKYVGLAKKLTYAVFRPQVANTFLHLASKSNYIFSGFISGKLLDSLIIGMMCFLGLSIFKIPYTILVSVIVGVTNIIPFFGPFIGAIPSAILILLADPTNLKPLIFFVIFIICLQQFDGNILGPKILGDSTGLSALMVIIAILIGGGFFGFIGMILGVPVFAVVSYLAQSFLHYRLSKKGYPTSTISFIDVSSIDDENNFMLYHISGSKTVSGRPTVLKRTLRKFDGETAPQSFTASIQADMNFSERSKEQKEKEQKKKEEPKKKKGTFFRRKK